MHSSHHLHLPTEIVVQIASYVDGDELERQKTLYACCLVSRQWYSATIAFLYERPRVDSGKAFQKFTETISPPLGARKNKPNLGSFVHRLNLSHLTYHSSNSLTARLLGRIKDNLEVFIAPSLSFALTLKNCSELSVENLGSLLSSPQLGENLQRLNISGVNRGLQPESINAIPAFLPGLTFLSVPGDMVDESFFDILNHMFPPINLEVLEFGLPCDDLKLNFTTKTLLSTLDTGLANLRSMGFAEEFVTGQRLEEDEEIDKILQERNRRRSFQPDAKDQDDDEQAGVYYT
ncbi:hypothetical protein BBP40_003848 [Aspergillus hancockii]|nr:hypothetical protein BBP40_003848 [Aspergillus hancockii]